VKLYNYQLLAPDLYRDLRYELTLGILPGFAPLAELGAQFGRGQKSIVRAARRTILTPTPSVFPTYPESDGPDKQANVTLIHQAGLKRHLANNTLGVTFAGVSLRRGLSGPKTGKILSCCASCPSLYEVYHQTGFWASLAPRLRGARPRTRTNRPPSEFRGQGFGYVTTPRGNNLASNAKPSQAPCSNQFNKGPSSANSPTR